MYLKILLVSVEFLILYRAENTLAKPLIGTSRSIFESEFPSVVCIIAAYEGSINNAHNFEDDIICSGTLISQYHVLTADHCSTLGESQRIQIVSGSIDVRLGRRYDFLWWISHNQWAHRQNRRNRYSENDISMIKLLEGVSSDIVTARLSSTPRRHLFGAPAVIVGWGELGNGVSPMIAHAGNVTVISDAECTEICRRLSTYAIAIPMAEFCSIGNPFVLLDDGDSGGPIFSNGRMIGVNTATFPLIGEISQQANVHSSVNFYRNYIEEQMNY